MTKTMVCAILYEMVHIKDPLLLIGKNSHCGSNGFYLLLSEWSFTICMMPYNHKCVNCIVKLNISFFTTSVTKASVCTTVMSMGSCIKRLLAANLKA